jgi:hypothetical protein
MRPSMRNLQAALPEALIRYAATMPTETREALTRAAAAFRGVPEAERPEFVQRYMAKAMINGIGNMVEESWLAGHGTLATPREKEQRRFEEADLEKLRRSPEWFATVIEPTCSVDSQTRSDAWEAFRENIAAAFGLGMGMSERAVAERGREQNRVNALAQTAKLMKAIKEVCKARKRKLSATKQCAGEIRKDVRNWLVAELTDLERRIVPLDETARKMKTLLKGRTWPSESKILGTISLMKTAEKAGVPFL